MNSPNQLTIVSTRIIVEHGYDIAVLQRANTGEFKGHWELPGGTVEPDEDIAEGALRESKEELGIPVELLPIQPERIEKRRIPVGDGTHGGKKYEAWGFLGIATSREIILDPDEHQDSIWLPPQEVLKIPTLSLTSRKAIMALGAFCSIPIKKPLV